MARMRSQGLSTPRRTAVSKTPPPEISSRPKPASSRIPASCRTSAVGSRPASGSCPSKRIVVSTSLGIGGTLARRAEADGAQGRPGLEQACPRERHVDERDLLDELLPEPSVSQGRERVPKLVRRPRLADVREAQVRQERVQIGPQRRSQP